MVASSERLVRTVSSTGLLGAIDSRPSLVVRALPPTVTGCQNLSGSARFSRRLWSAAFRRNCDLIIGHDAMLMAGLMLGRDDKSRRPETRSVSCDPLSENKGAGIRSRVTVCHNKLGGGTARLRKKPRPLVRSFQRGRRLASNKVGSTWQDGLVAFRRHFACIDRDMATVRRQRTTSFRGLNGVECKVLRGWRWPSFPREASQDQCEEWLRSLRGRAAIDGAHAGGLMGSRSPGQNGPVETTKNDKWNRTACSRSHAAADVSRSKGFAMRIDEQ